MQQCLCAQCQLLCSGREQPLPQQSQLITSSSTAPQCPSLCLRSALAKDKQTLEKPPASFLPAQPRSSPALSHVQFLSSISSTIMWEATGFSFACSCLLCPREKDVIVQSTPGRG